MERATRPATRKLKYASKQTTTINVCFFKRVDVRIRKSVVEKSQNGVQKVPMRLAHLDTSVARPEPATFFFTSNDIDAAASLEWKLTTLIQNVTRGHYHA